MHEPRDGTEGLVNAMKVLIQRIAVLIAAVAMIAMAGGASLRGF